MDDTLNEEFHSDTEPMEAEPSASTTSSEESTSQSRPNPKYEERRHRIALEKLGKRLAYILRYGAERASLSVTNEGYVLVADLMKVQILSEYSECELMDELSKSVSMRQFKRYQFSDIGDQLHVRCTYGRRMERNPCHANSNVKRLLDQSIEIIAKNITAYDLQDFDSDYILNVIMRKLKRHKNLTNKALRIFLVPTLEHMDFWGASAVNEASLKMMAKNCPNLKWISFRDLGYVVTDILVEFITKRLPHLESMNFTGCHHVTDRSINAIAKSCVCLRHLNLTFSDKVTEEALIRLVSSCSWLEELNIYDYKGFSSEGLERFYDTVGKRPFRLECPAVNTGNVEDVYDSPWERPNFR